MSRAVTGGAGYVGSHTIWCLPEQSDDFVVFNDLCNPSDVSNPFKVAPRRTGELHAFSASAAQATLDLIWQANRSLKQVMEDTWRWQSGNPQDHEN